MDRQVSAFALAILLSIVSSQIPPPNTETDATFLSAMKNLIWGPNPDNATQMDPSKFHQYSSARSPSTLLTSASVSVSGAACTLPQQIGTGPYRIPRWYYNPARQRCELFYWSGCCGNQNNFQTFQSCQQVCEESPNPCAVQTTGPLVTCLGGNSCGGGYYCHSGAAQTTQVCCPKPSTLDRCQQPLNIGIGNENLQRWYFNPLAQQCQTCVYKGLQGNENNFGSRNDCENACVVNPCRVGTPFRSQGVTVQCSAMNPTVCPAGYYCHIGADQSTSLCCQALGGDPCGQPMDRGTGGAQLQRWYWNVNQQCCLPFSYCGLKGTQNNFLSRTDCERTCYVYESPCNLPISLPATSCQADNMCGPSQYCHFGLVQDTTVCCPSEGDACSLPLNRGQGQGSAQRWYYDQNSYSCLPFQYAGTKGNSNNFLTQQACEERCGPNPCFEGRPFQGADGRTQTCTASASINTCPASYWCHVGADMSLTVCCPGASTNVCNLPMSTGEGNYNLDRYYFDSTSRTCRPFKYNGLKGNQNNFLTLRSCQLSCQPLDNPCIGQPAVTAAGQVLFCSATNKDACPINFYCHIGASPETTVCCPGATNPCSVPLAPGTGIAGLPRYYYNPDDRQCEPFTYNGKRGNQNNFLSQTECERTCPEELCLLSIDRGACANRVSRYAFDRQTNQCIAFEYTGCGGNLNNFASYEDCESTCAKVRFRR